MTWGKLRPFTHPVPRNVCANERKSEEWCVCWINRCISTQSWKPGCSNSGFGFESRREYLSTKFSASVSIPCIIICSGIELLYLPPTFKLVSCSDYFRPWKWRRFPSPKHIAFQRTTWNYIAEIELFKTIATRTPNLKFFNVVWYCNAGTR
jgi:hypothetical protein